MNVYIQNRGPSVSVPLQELDGQLAIVDSSPKSLDGGLDSFHLPYRPPWGDRIDFTALQRFGKTHVGDQPWQLPSYCLAIPLGDQRRTGESALGPSTWAGKHHRVSFQ